MLFGIYIGQVFKEYITGRTPEVKEEQRGNQPERSMLININILLFFQEIIKIGTAHGQYAHRRHRIAPHAVFLKPAEHTFIYIKYTEKEDKRQRQVFHLEISIAYPVQQVVFKQHFHRQVQVVEPVIGNIHRKQCMPGNFYQYRKQHKPPEGTPETTLAFFEVAECKEQANNFGRLSKWDQHRLSMGKCFRCHKYYHQRGVHWGPGLRQPAQLIASSLSFARELPGCGVCR